MTLTQRIARPMLAGMFIVGGNDAVRHPASKAARAEPVALAVAQPLGLPDDVTQLVQINGAVQVGAGVLLAVGRLPRLAAAALAASLVPTTIAGHPFWKETDKQVRNAQRLQFLKNLAMLGGLVLAMGDRRGRGGRFQRRGAAR
jgi:uncharacterized membrane protein YphA (DoxX/SURF4 family)